MTLSDFPRPYLKWFELFAAEEYYEAHEVLEQLWQEGGKAHPDHAFFKGLIQISGVFRHFQLHHAEPGHQIHGERLRPALRLLDSALENLDSYPQQYHGLDLSAVRRFCEGYRRKLREEPGINPWEPGKDAALSQSRAPP